MPKETEQFIISDVRWNHAVSREIGSGPQQRRRSSIRSASVRCKKCGEVWEATKGRELGQFRTTIGYIHLTCPSGDAAEPVSMVALDQD